MKNDELTIEVICRNLPGVCFRDRQSSEGQTYEPVYLGIQKGSEVIEAVPGDDKQVVFRPTFRIAKQPNGSPNFLGPFAKGTPQERFFYLSWGVLNEGGSFKMFRRAKIHLNHLKWEHIRPALSHGQPLKVVINMTGAKGDPLCASVRRDRANWQV